METAIGLYTGVLVPENWLGFAVGVKRRASGIPSPTDTQISITGPP